MNFKINTNAFSTALSEIFGFTPKTSKNIKTDWGRVILRANGSTLFVEVDTGSVWLRAGLQATASIIEEGGVSISSLALLSALVAFEDDTQLSVTTVAATESDPATLALHATEKIWVTLPAKIEARVPQAEGVEFEVGRADFIECAHVASYIRDRNALHSIYVGKNSLSAISHDKGISFLWQKQGVKVAKTTGPVALAFHRPEINALINHLSMNPAKTLKCEWRYGVQSHLAIVAGGMRVHLTIPKKPDRQYLRVLPQLLQPRPYRFLLPIAELQLAFKVIRKATKASHNATIRFQFDRAERILHITTLGEGHTSQIVNIVDSLLPDDSTGFLEVSFLTRRVIDAFKLCSTGKWVQIDFGNERDPMRVSYHAEDRVCAEVWKRNEKLLTRERLVMFCAVENLKAASLQARTVDSLDASSSASHIGELTHA